MVQYEIHHCRPCCVVRKPSVEFHENNSISSRSTVVILNRRLNPQKSPSDARAISTIVVASERRLLRDRVSLTTFAFAFFSFIIKYQYIKHLHYLTFLSTRTLRVTNTVYGTRLQCPKSVRSVARVIGHRRDHCRFITRVCVCECNIRV